MAYELHGNGTGHASALQVPYNCSPEVMDPLFGEARFSGSTVTFPLRKFVRVELAIIKQTVYFTCELLTVETSTVDCGSAALYRAAGAYAGGGRARADLNSHRKGGDAQAGELLVYCRFIF